MFNDRKSLQRIPSEVQILIDLKEENLTPSEVLGRGSVKIAKKYIVTDPEDLKTVRRLNLCAADKDEIAIKEMRSDITDEQKAIYEKNLKPEALIGESIRQIIENSKDKETYLANPTALVLFKKGYALISRYEENGNLVDYFALLNENEDPEKRTDRRQLLIKMFESLYASMEFLHANGIGHFDISARNALVKDDLTVTLADYGLATFFENHEPDEGRQGYIHLPDRHFGPAKWMDVNSTFHRIYSRASDFYALKVAMLETMLYAAGVKTHDVLFNNLSVTEFNDWRKKDEVSDEHMLFALLKSVETYLKKHEDDIRCRQVFEVFQAFEPFIKNHPTHDKINENGEIVRPLLPPKELLELGKQLFDKASTQYKEEHSKTQPMTTSQLMNKLAHGKSSRVETMPEEEEKVSVGKMANPVERIKHQRRGSRVKEENEKKKTENPKPKF